MVHLATSPRGRKTLGISHFEQPRRLLPNQRGIDEPLEEWVRFGRARFEFRVCLSCYVIRVNVTREFDEFDQVTVWASSREHETGFPNLIAILVVYLVSMTMALVDISASVNRSDNRTWD
jgi:hypothetical protein